MDNSFETMVLPAILSAAISLIVSLVVGQIQHNRVRRLTHADSIWRDVKKAIADCTVAANYALAVKCCDTKQPEYQKMTQLIGIARVAISDAIRVSEPGKLRYFLRAARELSCKLSTHMRRGTKPPNVTCARMRPNSLSATRRVMMTFFDLLETLPVNQVVQAEYARMGEIEQIEQSRDALMNELKVYIEEMYSTKLLG